MVKLPYGRPSKFQPEFCEQLIEHMSEGYSFDSFAGVISVTFETLYRWKKEFPSFNQAYQLGCAKRRDFDERLLKQYANGDIKASPAALIFKLKTAHKLNDDLTGVEKLKLIQLGLMTPEQIKEMAVKLLAKEAEE